MFAFFDPQYMLLVLLPTIILSGLAQLFIRSAYSRWGQTRNGAGYSGPEVAQHLMRNQNLNVGLERSQGELSDHYDPSSHTVRMSPGVAGTNSVAAMAIVAHELGHAQQHQQGSFLITARNFLLPAVTVSPTLSYGLILGGLFLGLTGLAWLGVIVFGISVLFMLLTLPVEIDASMRGLRMLQDAGLMTTEQDRSGARQMLTAAALTYVAAAVTSILQLLYFVSLVSRRD
jgi:Zn-dependent membrane protease YugP